MNLIDAIETFPDELSCVKFLEKMRWPNGVKCLACESDKVTFFIKQAGVRTRKNSKGVTVEVPVPVRYLYQCKECRYQFTPTVGTLFNDTHLPLRTWFLATCLIIDAKKGLSANQLKRHLDIGSYRSAWYLCHRIRKAMETEGGMFGGTVEMDETFVGGRYDQRRKRIKQDRQAVMGVVQRANEAGPSQVHAFTIPKPTRKVIEEVVAKHISFDAQIYTDDWAGYKHLHTEDFRKHAIVVHTKGEYVRGDVHTNSVEGFWSLVKRQIIGQHHFVSVKHLQRYLDEMSFRFNNREADPFTLVVIRLLIASAMPYQKLIKPEPSA